MARRKVTEFEIANRLMAFDAEVYCVLNSTPRKYRFNKEQQVQDAHGEARAMTCN